MRDKLKLIAAIDRLCKYPVPLTQKIRMVSYDQDRLQKIFKIVMGATKEAINEMLSYFSQH